MFACCFQEIIVHLLGPECLPALLLMGLFPSKRSKTEFCKSSWKDALGWFLAGTEIAEFKESEIPGLIGETWNMHVHYTLTVSEIRNQTPIQPIRKGLPNNVTPNLRNIEIDPDWRSSHRNLRLDTSS